MIRLDIHPGMVFYLLICFDSRLNCSPTIPAENVHEGHWTAPPARPSPTCERRQESNDHDDFFFLECCTRGRCDETGTAVAKLPEWNRNGLETWRNS